MSHPDNTFRALKDQPLFVERWQCKWGWHRWTRWNPPQHSPGGMFVKQSRECTDCGLADYRSVKGT